MKDFAGSGLAFILRKGLLDVGSFDPFELLSSGLASFPSGKAFCPDSNQPADSPEIEDSKLEHPDSV